MKHYLKDKKKIVVTGSSGQLGSELSDLLLEDSRFDCFFLDRSDLPLDDTSIIQDVLARYKPDIVVHTAAYTAVDKAESEPDLVDIVNHIACEEIAEYCRRHEARLIALSTDYVFDGLSRVPLKEDAFVNPINVYGFSKLRGEQAIQKRLPDSIIIRTSWVYSSYGNNFVKTMVRLMNHRGEISVVNDQIGSPTYARDLARAIIHIINSQKWIGGIYNYSNEGEISWYDFACAIKEITGLNCVIRPVNSTEYPTTARRPQYSLLDKSKIKSTFAVDVPMWKDSLEGMLIAYSI